MTYSFSLRRAGALVCALATVSAFAAYDSNQALALLDAQQFDQAYQYLDRELDRNAATQQDLFLLGMAAKQSGRYDEAAYTFRNMLIREPGVTRVQLELIDAYQLAGRFDEAESLSASMLASDNLDERARAELQRFSGALAQRRSGNSGSRSMGVSLYAGLGYVYDSNVNSGPDVDKVSIFNLPFTLSPDAKRTADSGVEMNAGINLQKALGAQNFIYGGASVDHTNYFDQSDFDKTVLSGRIGYGHQLGENWQVRVPVSVSYTRFGQETPLEYTDYAATPTLTYRINPQTEVSAFAGITHRTFKEAASKDTYRIGANGSWQQGPHALSGSASMSTENAERKSTEAERINLSGNYRYQANDRLSLSTGFGTEFTRFHGKSPLFGKQRKEIGYDIDAGLTYRIPALEADLNANVKHHINRGNLEYYEYDKTIATISLQKSFAP